MTNYPQPTTQISGTLSSTTDDMEQGNAASTQDTSQEKEEGIPAKVFIDCRWYSQPGQGVVTFISRLHEAAERKILSESSGVRFEFWYGVESLNTIEKTLLPNNARIIEVGRRSMLWRLFLFPFFLKRHGFSIAHFQYICPLFKFGIRYITSIHDVLFLRNPEYFSFSYRLLRGILFSHSARRSDEVLTISNQSKADIKSLLGRRGEIHIIPCGPGDLSLHQPSELKPIPGLEQGQFILTVGRVEPRKNYPRLCRAFVRSGLENDGAKLVIVGFCPKEFSAELSLFKDFPGVVWLDRISDQNLSWLYAHAKAFIFPSHCEGFGIPVIEAIAANLNVGISTSYPLTDVLDVADERFDPKDEEAISEALINLWKSNRPSMSRDLVLARYNWDVAASIYLQLINTMIMKSQLDEKH